MDTTTFSYYDLSEENYEDDPFMNENEADFKLFVKRMQSISILQIITTIGKFFLCLFVIMADIYLIVIICRNKNLKAVKINRYIMHYAIFNIFMFCSYPAFELIMAIFHEFVMFNWYGYCLERQLQATGVTGLFLCAFCLALDWFLTVYCTDVKPIFKKIYNHSLSIVYLICFIKLSVDFFICSFSYIIINVIETLVGIISIIFLIFCNVKKRALRNDNSYSLTMATVMISCWIPMYIYDWSYEYIPLNYTLKFLMIATFFIPEYLAFGSSILVIVWLGKINKYFRVAYRKSCACCKCCNVITDYTGDDGEFEDSEDIAHEDISNMANNAAIL